MKTKLLTLIAVMMLTQINLVSADVCRPERGNLLRVTGVEDDDTLNVRAGYTTKYEILFKLAPDAEGLNLQDVAYKSEYCLNKCSSYLRGEKSLESDILEKCRNKSKIWYSIVDVNGKQGWASGKYLTEYPAVNEDVNVTNTEANSNKSPSLKLVGKDSNTAVIGKIKTDDKTKKTTEEQAYQNFKTLLREWFLINPQLRNENFIKFVADKWNEADKPGDPKLIEELLLNATNQFAEFTRMTEQKEQERAKELQLQALEKIKVQRAQQVANNFGYKEIKPGRTLDEIEKIAGCRLQTDWWSAKFSNRCYNSKKYTFWASVDDLETIQWLKMDLGILESLYWYDYISSTEDAESGNIYASMRKNLDTKYKLEYEFTDRDVAFFNNEELNQLLVVYEKGMVILMIERVQASEYKKEVRLRLAYQNPTLGEAYYKEHLPTSISSDDF